MSKEHQQTNWTSYYTDLPAILETANRPIEWLIKDFMPAHNAILMFGPSFSGKTYVALDMAVSLALGKDWNGLTVPKAVPVIYVPSEGQQSLGRRLMVRLERYHGQGLDLSGGKLVMPKFDLLLDGSDGGKSLQALTALRDHLGAGLIIVDVLKDMAPNADENSGAFGTAYGRLRDLSRDEDHPCAVMALHHTGWDDNAKDRPRGHSSLYGAVDLTYGISARTITEDEYGRPTYTIVTVQPGKPRNIDMPRKMPLALAKPYETAAAATIIGTDLQGQNLPLADQKETLKALQVLGAGQVQGDGPAGQTAWADALGIARQSLATHAKRLLDAGFVTETKGKRGAKLYTITEKGTETCRAHAGATPAGGHQRAAGAGPPLGASALQVADDEDSEDETGWTTAEIRAAEEGIPLWLAEDWEDSERAYRALTPEEKTALVTTLTVRELLDGKVTR